MLLEQRIASVAVPALGAGNGGLDWPAVKPRIEAALNDVPAVHVVVFEPSADALAAAVHRTAAQPGKGKARGSKGR